jgi:hypothetical protein
MRRIALLLAMAATARSETITLTPEFPTQTIGSATAILMTGPVCPSVIANTIGCGEYASGSTALAIVIGASKATMILKYDQQGATVTVEADAAAIGSNCSYEFVLPADALNVAVEVTVNQKRSGASRRGK